MNGHLLIADDDFDLCELLRVYLTRNGIEVSILHDAVSLEEKLEGKRPDVIAMDVLMPGTSGLTALERLRASGDDTPVIMLTSHPDDIDRTGGLETGADDYIGKPFDPCKLLERVQAILQRRDASWAVAEKEKCASFVFGRFTLDFESGALRSEGRLTRLPSGEFELLKIFVKYSMHTLSRTVLSQLLFGSGERHVNRNVDVRVWRLRQILEMDATSPRFIQTVRGHGYVFVPEGERVRAPR